MMDTLPNPSTDPAGYVLAIGILVESAGKLLLSRDEATPDDVAFLKANGTLWRGIAARHRPLPPRGPSDDDPECARCGGCSWPCADLQDAVATARAYMDSGPS